MSPFTLHFCGDSHLWLMQQAAVNGLLAPLSWHFTVVPSATAVGLRNTQSKSKAAEQIRTGFMFRSVDNIPVYHLGEVDCGYWIWHRAETTGASVHAMFNESLASYETFVNAMRDEFDQQRVIISSATLPTIQDGREGGEIAKFRKTVKASLQERTDLTLEYNQRLKEMCARNDFWYLDFSSRMINPATGVIYDELCHPDPGEHHLHPELGPQVLAQATIDFIIDMAETI